MDDFDERYLDVNEDGVLRIPFELRLAWFVLSRQWVLLIVGIATMLVSDSSTSELVRSAISWPALLMQLPVVLVVYSAGRRKPHAPRWVRWIWLHGPQLMLASVVGGWLWLALWLYQAETWNRWPELFLCSMSLLDIAIYRHIRLSEYIIKIFSEFSIE